MRKLALLTGVLYSAVAMPGGSVSGALVIFDSRENVNLVQADNVAISALQTAGSSPLKPPQLIGAHEGLNTATWDGGNNPPGGTNSITLNFQTIRNLQTIRTWSQFGNFGVTSVVVETSNNGSSWTTRPSTLAIDSANQRTITLDTPVDAQYLRVTGTGFDDANRRWLIAQLRVFGSPGSLQADEFLDLISSTAYSGGLTFTRNGSVSITAVDDVGFVNDALDPLQRKVLYNMGTGDGFTLQFDRQIDFGKFGFITSTSPTLTDTNAQWRLEFSSDGAGYTTLLNMTGQALGTNFFAFGKTDASYLRFTYLSTTSSDNRITEIFAFQIPEPSTVWLLSVGTGILYYVRCRQRG